jgi:hypothetical protein
MSYEPPPYPGVVDYSDDPILPPWYIPGWTSQNEDNVVAPQSPFQLTSLPSTLTRVEVTGTWDDGVGNPLGGYMTFEQSCDLLVTIAGSTPTYYTIPARLVGDIPIPNTIAWNMEGSGKINLIYGQLDVVLLATDNTQISPLPIAVDEYSAAGDISTTPASWVYHVREYWLGGRMYDITVPGATSPTDINNLIVAGTIYLNDEAQRGY